MSIELNCATICDLEWDTVFFGVNCGKVVLHKPLDTDEWELLKKVISKYEFVSITNLNSEPINSQFIGKDTDAFLADVNIQFIKESLNALEIDNHVEIEKNKQYDPQIFEIADFKYSKFIEDPELRKRNGKDVYKQWVLNAFDREDKYFAIYRDETGKINGFLLHSYHDDSCVIELIAVHTSIVEKGIGSKMFDAVEVAAKEKGFSKIEVGTQIRNSNAINFYQKNGCKQVEIHQTYHLWRK